MSISNFCIDQIVKSTFDDMSDRDFYMMIGVDSNPQSHIIAPIITNQKMSFDKNYKNKYIIEEKHLVNGMWEYTLKETEQEKLRQLNGWIKWKESQIQRHYNNHYSRVQFNFKNKLDKIIKRKLNKYHKYKFNIIKSKRNAIKRKYYHLKFNTFRNVIIPEIEKRVLIKN